MSEDGFSKRYSALRERVQTMMALDFPYGLRPIQAGRPAAVLLLCGLSDSPNGLSESPNASDSLSDLKILVTLRTDRLETHKGQYAFPGGMQEEADREGVNAVEGLTETVKATLALERTALRETQEEMGIPSEWIETFGALPPIWTPSGFYVTPIVGVLRRPIEATSILPSEFEIADWFWFDLATLRDPSVYGQEARRIEFEGKMVEVNLDVFQIGAHRVWGVTGAILKNFIGRWEKLG